MVNPARREEAKAFFLPMRAVQVAAVTVRLGESLTSKGWRALIGPSIADIYRIIHCSLAEFRCRYDRDLIARSRELAVPMAHEVALFARRSGPGYCEG